jgi:hypothetical protein
MVHKTSIKDSNVKNDKITYNIDFDEIEKIKKKRGRKSKKEKELLEEFKKYQEENGLIEENIKIPKKRGRKPKGGKIIKKSDLLENNTIEKKTNIILHLKCGSSVQKKYDLISEINYDPEIQQVQAYDENDNNFTDQYYNIEVDKNMFQQYSNLQQSKTNSIMEPETQNNINHMSNIGNNKTKFVINNSAHNIDDKNNVIDDDSNINKQELSNKLKELQFKLHTNNIPDTQSDCFWCTCSFNNLPIRIPKCEINNTFEAYGCFCQPECAVAYLFNEHIDNSTKWERYSLLNNIYKNVYKYTKKIKPAPSPFYLLDKYYGTLSIQEYRQLMHDDELLIVVDKPLTRITPEIFQENNDTFSLSFGNDSHKKKYRLYRNKPKKNNQKQWVF